MGRHVVGSSTVVASGLSSGMVARVRRLGVWGVIAALLAVGGVVGTVFAARSVARTDAQNSHQAFKQSSTEIASTLRLAIQREQDLIVDASGFVIGSPHASNAQFVAWATSVHALARYPEMIGLGHSVLVPYAQLPAFAAHAVKDPAGRLAANGTFQVLPAGKRAYYCFAVAGVARGLQAEAGVDYCASGAVGAASVAARDSGKSAYVQVQAGKTKLLAVLTPVYRTPTPATVAGRRRWFLGWVGMEFVPNMVLAGALRGHPHTAVRFRYHAGPWNPVFRSGKAPGGAHEATIALPNGAAVQIFASVTGAGVFVHGDSLLVLVGGVLLSVLLALLLLVLATARARALRLVSDRTEQLSFQAMHDGLTELPNRALVIDRAELMLARARRQHTPTAAMFIDVDGFKHINDTFGHAAGDEFLQIIADRLSSVVREVDTVGRLGGDEFVVLVEGETLYAGPELVAERMLSVLRQPVELDAALGRPHSCSVSIGVAVGQRANADELLRDADLAMYQAKQAGKDRYVLFEQRMQTASADHIALEADLHDALTNHQFFLLYQPTFDLRTQVVTGVEALLRWAHPQRGIVPPDVFIPLAEQNAMIIPVGRWVLQQACRQAAAWRAAGHTIGMSVNVSARQLEHDEFVGEVRDALTDSGLPPEALTLEITETVLMRDAATAAARLQALKTLGIRIAIDDFGTGYSSLAYLRQFPVDSLKIDRTFITGISSSHQAGALMHTLIQLGKALGLETLGEGIEEHAQLEQLKNEECDSGQGFLFARPLDVDAVTRFLSRDRPKV